MRSHLEDDFTLYVMRTFHASPWKKAFKRETPFTPELFQKDPIPSKTCYCCGGTKWWSLLYEGAPRVCSTCHSPRTDVKVRTWEN
jgi:hypothetical protein